MSGPGRIQSESGRRRGITTYGPTHFGSHLGERKRANRGSLAVFTCLRMFIFNVVHTFQIVKCINTKL